MAITGAIFDVDGTLLDSMGAWRTVGSDYMRSLGLTPPPDLDDAILRLSVEEAAEYIKNLGAPGSAEKILQFFGQCHSAFLPFCPQHTTKLHFVPPTVSCFYATERCIPKKERNALLFWIISLSCARLCTGQCRCQG